MNPSIVAIALTGFAALLVLMLMPKEDKPFAVAVCVTWVFVAAIAFLLADASLTFIALFMLLAAAGAASPRGGVFLYIAVMPALPAGLLYDVPMPGLNYLITLDYPKLAALVLLGPAFIKASFTRAPAHFRGIEHLLLFFVLFTGLMAFRDLPFTSVLRTIFDLFVLVYLPFIAISRTLITQKDIDWALRAFFASFLMLAVIGVISTLRSWNYYASIGEGSFGKAYFDVRNGLLRVSATMIPSLLAALTSAGLILALVLRARKEISPLFAYISIGILGFTCFATGARGGWLAAIACVAAYFVFYYGGAALRRLAYAAAIICVLVGFSLIFSDSDVLNDEYGTVNYRAELIRTSVAQIQERPLFGASDIFNLPRFQHLRQGEGIIDLVNAYIQIVLFYGLVGLGTLLGAHALGAMGGLRELNELPRPRDLTPAQAEQRRTVAFLLAMQGGYLVLIATISFVAQVPHYGYLILAALVAQARILKTQRLAAAEPDKTIAETEAIAPPPPEAPPSSPSPAPSGPVPYGARFVRRQ
ncbi:O-antigen ligase family protein [Hyphococcus sp.]|uniref:O-antigen ligase family protein n=1 Tax=Hyphococcus sp. TaxID=2038636 RepID=UPI0035C67BD6